MKLMRLGIKTEVGWTKMGVKAVKKKKIAFYDDLERETHLIKFYW